MDITIITIVVIALMVVMIFIAYFIAMIALVAMAQGEVIVAKKGMNVLQSLQSRISKSANNKLKVK